MSAKLYHPNQRQSRADHGSQQDPPACYEIIYFFIFLCFCKKERYRESFHSLVHSPIWPGQSQDRRTQCRSAMWNSNTQVLELSLAASQGAHTNRELDWKQSWDSDPGTLTPKQRQSLCQYLPRWCIYWKNCNRRWNLAHRYDPKDKARTKQWLPRVGSQFSKAKGISREQRSSC